MIQQQFGSLTDVVKNLIIINALVFLATLTIGKNVVFHYGATHYISNPNFQPYQLVTAFFLHNGLFHLIFNMLVLFFIGPMVERMVGSGRFLLLFLVAGFGANVFNLAFDYAVAHQLMQGLSSEQIAMATLQAPFNDNIYNADVQQLFDIWRTRGVGASGATYGVLFAFAALNPDFTLRLIIPPISVKAKYLVLFLATLEFFRQTGSTNSNVGHFVHLSGGVIGMLMILFWRKR